MRIADIILESDNGPQHIFLDDPGFKSQPERVVEEFIQKNCQPWLKLARRESVYRGINTDGRTKSMAFTRKTVQNRRPKDTNLERHNFFNDMISMAGGVANRSNSIFVSGDTFAANDYGSLYAVYPIGNFHYTWSPTWADWSEDLDDFHIFDKMSDELKINKGVNLTHAEKMDNIEKLRDAGHFYDLNYYENDLVNGYIIADKDLYVAIQSQHEIMINCDTYLMVLKLLNDRLRKT